MNNVLRNIIGIFAGFIVAIIIIIFGISINSKSIIINVSYNNPLFPFQYWRQLIENASISFFLILLFSTGLAAIIGGIVTAIIVKQAKTAYAIFLGFILYIIGLLDSWITPGHPIWYNIIILFILFPFSWLSGKIVDIIFYKKR